MSDVPTRPRLADVAAAAGVSKSAASKVLNDAPGTSVSEETRARIHAAAERLGYRPHGPARSLATGRTGAIALVVPPLSNPTHATIARGASRRALERGFMTLTAEDLGDPASRAGLEMLIESGRLDGVLIGSASADSDLPYLLDRLRIPHVFVNRSNPRGRANVVMDVAQSARAAVDFLVGLGHQQLGHIGGPSEYTPSVERIQAFRRRCRELRLPEPTIALHSFDEGGGARGLAELRSVLEPPTAVFTSSFAQAVGVLGAAAQSGLDIPGELSVLANDDYPMADYLVPTLSTVQTPLAELGAAAVDQLIAIIGGADPHDTVIPTVPHIIARGSTGPGPDGIPHSEVTLPDEDLALPADPA
ncbi:LacI family DNA-binding transcriptional regulator [Kitasatospora cineracea]|uniref:LacI family DNA-binding transcriptional regulator n=1 Tax=Kitasatospora cineracea TaxID=88074 RepID=UPI0038209A77